MKKVITSEETERYPVYEIGGKASNLFKLKDLGLPVPNWAVIPNSMQILNPDQSKEEVLNDIIKELSSVFDPDDNSANYAVRSSAVDEDSGNESFAGQFETELHISFTNLKVAIQKVWDSASSQRVQQYRKDRNLPEDQGIAVIVQTMISSDVSGVAFGIDPVSGDPQTKIISSVYGLGEGLVSGELDADTFTVRSGEIIPQLTTKLHYLSYDPVEKIIKKFDVRVEDQDRPTLNSEQIKELTDLLDHLENKLGGPQDVEFCYSNSKLYVLQTRPVTAAGHSGKGEYIVWDNSNIIESYPGITTPLTFSFIIKMYERVYRQFVGLLGVKESEIEEHAAVFANTLGLVRGRVYYNLLTWYKMLAMLPGYSINAGFMENMMGVKEQFELKDEFKMSKGLAWFRIVGMLFKMLWLQMRLKGERRRFLRHLNTVMSEYLAYDFGKMTSKEIIEKYKNFEQSLLLQWKAPLINDFFAMIWFGLLHKQTARYFQDSPNIQNDLLCGNRDIISVEPIHRSMRLAQMIAEDPSCKTLFENESAEKCWEVIQSNIYPEIRALFDSYLLDFGERCIGELKLETISYSQDPVRFVKIIQSYIHQNVFSKHSATNIDLSLRLEAEEKVKERFKGKPIKRWWFNVVLSRARDLVSNRENLRYERTRGFGMVRKMFVALGERWHEQGYLASSRDIFYLELNELLFSDGIFQSDFSKLIENRKIEFDNYRNQQEPEERFYTYGMNFTDDFIYSKEKILPLEGNLKGIGCCPGRVQGKVRVVKDPNEISSLNNDILVTSNTDPGWVTLFPTASAIIVERGSLLSHSAIVSREMGIPCIVSVTGLLRTLKTGDEIIMDGSTGEIQIINQ